MQTKIILLFLLTSLRFELSAQTYSSTINDDDIMDFMTWLIKTDNLSSDKNNRKPKQIALNITTWDSTDFVSTGRHYLYKYKFFDSTFSPADKQYILQQFKTAKDSTWRHQFPNSKLVDLQKDKSSKIYYYSLPLFSADKRLVIIRKEYYCGNLCADGGTYIYQKLSGKWYFFAAFDTWKS